MGKLKYSKAQLAYFRECGRAGGETGGRIRAIKLSPERRREIARMGGLAMKARREAKAAKA